MLCCSGSSSYAACQTAPQSWAGMQYVVRYSSTYWFWGGVQSEREVDILQVAKDLRELVFIIKFIYIQFLVLSTWSHETASTDAIKFGDSGREAPGKL